MLFCTRLTVGSGGWQQFKKNKGWWSNLDDISDNCWSFQSYLTASH